jgi:hypothetical protein
MRDAREGEPAAEPLGSRARVGLGEKSAQKKADPGKVGFEWGW